MTVGASVRIGGGLSGPCVIELIGAPGVGKTAVVHTLRSSGRPRCLDASAAIRPARHEALEPFLTRPGVLPRVIRWSSLRRLLLRKPTAEERRTALRVMASDWGPFIEFCLQPISADTRPAVDRLIAQQWVIDTLQIRALVELRALPQVVLMDEPLGFRLSFFSQEAAEERARRYFELVPLPTAVIHLDAEVDTIIARIRYRHETTGRTAMRHEGLDREALRDDIDRARGLAGLAARTFEERGSQVLRVDAELPIPTIASRLRSFVRDVERRHGLR